MNVLRIRQVVVAATDRDATVARLQAELGLGAPYEDPGVGEFGLVNAVLPVGDQFFEVVSPKEPGTAAGRWIERCGGDAGYMVLFQVASIADARKHLQESSIRTVWSADLPEISGTHAHPSDIGGAIVSFDESRPPSEWHWAGPSWRDQVRTERVSAITGITVAASDPRALCDKWSRALALPAGEAHVVLTLPDQSTISFVEGEAGRQGLVAVDLRAASPSTSAHTAEIGGVLCRVH